MKARAAELARRAGRTGAWKDYVAKARTALIDEQRGDEMDAADEDDDADSADVSVSAANDNEPLESGVATSEAWSSDASNSSTGDTEYGGNDDSDTDYADASDNDADDRSYDSPYATTDPSRDTAAVAASLAALAGATPAALQAVYDALAALGCVPAYGGALGKALNGETDRGREEQVESDLAKALSRVEALERRLAQQSELVERVAATPAPARTAASSHARLVGKVEDADPTASEPISANDTQKAFASLTADERTFLLMKASLRNPIPIP